MSANQCSGRLKVIRVGRENLLFEDETNRRNVRDRFSCRRDVLMTGNGLNRIMLGNSGQQGLQAGVLCFGKRLEIAAFQFDTDGKSIAFFSALKRRYAGMIGHVVAGNELDGFALTLMKKWLETRKVWMMLKKGCSSGLIWLVNNFSTAPVLYSKGAREILWRTTNEMSSSGSRGLKLGE